MIKLQLNPTAKLLRQFAWVAVPGFAMLALALHRLTGLPNVGAIGLAAVGPITLMAQLLGVRSVPLFVWRALTVLTYPLGFVLFPILVGLVYYGVFTPIGLVFRALGRDSLQLRLDRSQVSYWNERKTAKPSSSYFKLY